MYLNDILTRGGSRSVGETDKGWYFAGMTPGKKYTLSTSIFYLVLLPSIPVVNRYSPSGPCTPGMGFLLLFYTPFMAAIGFLYSIIGRILGNRSFTGPAIINAVVILAIGVWMGAGSI